MPNGVSQMVSLLAEPPSVPNIPALFSCRDSLVSPPRKAMTPGSHYRGRVWRPQLASRKCLTPKEYRVIDRHRFCLAIPRFPGTRLLDKGRTMKRVETIARTLPDRQVRLLSRRRHALKAANPGALGSLGRRLRRSRRCAARRHGPRPVDVAPAVRDFQDRGLTPC